MLKQNIKKLSKSLQNSPIFLEYIKIKEKVETSSELKLLKLELNYLKQQITKNMYDEEKHNKLVEEYNDKLEEYNNHPLIQNFEYLKEEIENELNFIREKISE